MWGIAALFPVDGFADFFNTVGEARSALLRVFVHAGFVFVELVLTSIFCIGDIRHDDIGAGEDALFPSVFSECLECCCGGDIDIVKEEACDGDHVQSESEVFCGIIGCNREIATEGRIVMGNIRPHADHIEVHFLEEDDVAGEVVKGLPGQRAHDT